MTLPPNIKEEVEKAIAKLLSEQVVYSKGDIHSPLMEFATQFYERGVGDRDAIAKAAIKYALEGYDYFSTCAINSAADSYLASDEYKKLVGDK